MQNPNRALAFLTYLLPFIGSLLVFLLNRKNALALYHACQALALFGGLILVPVSWLVLGWLLAQIPMAGPILTISLFTLVLAAAAVIVVGWLMGLSNALRAKFAPIPVFGGWGDKTFERLYRP